eukprot:Platyproteum_vivax@DN7530_c1_g1_i4.p1
MYLFASITFLFCLILGGSCKGLQGTTVKAPAASTRHLIDDADNDGNACYADGDQFDIAIGEVIDDTNTGRADYFKCTPAGTYAVGGVNHAKNIYTKLYKLHSEVCVHVQFVYTEALREQMENFILKRPPYYCPDENDGACVNERLISFQESFKDETSDVLKFFDTDYAASQTTVTKTCKDNNRALYSFTFDFRDSQVQATLLRYEHETGANVFYDLTKLSMCAAHSSGDDEGAACLWFLKSVDVLPANQQNGFNNSELKAGLTFPVMRSSIDSKIPGGDEDNVSISETQKDYNLHCHYTPNNNGVLRVRSYQHTLERKYPTDYRKVCFCDWRTLGNLVTRCDCTLNGSANGGCNADQTAQLATVGVSCNNC